MLQSIELDCAPGNPRPGDLIEKVIEGTGLELKEPISKLFGNWTWEFDVPAEHWAEKIKPIVMPRIKALYERGYIRYGSW